jgi:capsular exopolysaccharide synthesis family protein
MSQIFDALQRSEAERSGDESARQLEATELLRSVEGQVSQKWATTAVLDQADGRRTTQTVPDRPEVSERPDLSQLSAPRPKLYAPDEFQELPYSPDANSRLVSVTEVGGPAAEAFRLLSVRLHEIRQTRPLKKLLVTSTIPKEGKSTVAANLACSLARKKDERTLLLEGDVRRPSLTQLFGLGKAPGLCEWLRGDTSRAPNLYHMESTGLWILPSGKAPDSPLELLQSARLPLLLEQLAARFDWIVLDSPPVLPLADTSILMGLADGILLVTRPGVTEKQPLEKGLKLIDNSKLIGALVNSSKSSTYSSYYYQPSAAAS